MGMDAEPSGTAWKPHSAAYAHVGIVATGDSAAAAYGDWGVASEDSNAASEDSVDTQNA